MSHRTAACSCGQLSVTVQGDPLRVSVCHCLACQRRTGSVFGAQARFTREGATFQGESRAWSRAGDDGGRATFHFCPTCGATVWYEIEGYDTAQVTIPVGAFADPAFPAPRVSVYEDRRHAWVTLPGGMEHHA
jgi:hypothetical protein